jgi:hypothetical protein
MSPNTEIALRPWETKATKFIPEVPAIRVPLGIGIIVKGSVLRNTAAA